MSPFALIHYYVVITAKTISNIELRLVRDKVPGKSQSNVLTSRQPKTIKRLSTT